MHVADERSAREDSAGKRGGVGGWGVGGGFKSHLKF